MSGKRSRGNEVIDLVSDSDDEPAPKSAHESGYHSGRRKRTDCGKFKSSPSSPSDDVDFEADLRAQMVYVAYSN